MVSTTLTICTQGNFKRETSEVSDYFGLRLSSVTRAFCKQMVNTCRIPPTFAP